MESYNKISHTPRLIEKLSDLSGESINIVKAKLTEAEIEANHRIMWEPNKYREFTKQSKNKNLLVSDIAKELLGISGVRTTPEP